MNVNEHNTVDELIVKYLDGKSSPEEIRQLELWTSTSEANRNYFKQFYQVWALSNPLNISTPEALQKVLKRINKQTVTRNLWHFLQKVAAVLFIPLLAASVWLLMNGGFGKMDETKTQKIVAAFGTYTSFQLPDGSNVWLNSGSSLEFPEKFDTRHRVVQLTGEAYFEVLANQKSPFLVKTPYFDVTATGTRFNVSAYKNWQNPAVALVEGKVNIQRSGSENIVQLRPNHCLQMDTLSGEISILNEDTYKHYAWKDGKMVFRNDLLSTVAKRISLQYNVDIEIVDNQVQEYRFRATFENESLGELLTLLKLSSPFDYREINPHKRPDGTFTRKKILIYSSNN